MQSEIRTHTGKSKMALTYDNSCIYVSYCFRLQHCHDGQVHPCTDICNRPFLFYTCQFLFETLSFNKYDSTHELIVLVPVYFFPWRSFRQTILENIIIS